MSCLPRPLLGLHGVPGLRLAWVVLPAFFFRVEGKGGRDRSLRRRPWHTLTGRGRGARGVARQTRVLGRGGE
eukprot:11990263-Alexandrium_andersonii.AAC.1